MTTIKQLIGIFVFTLSLTVQVHAQSSLPNGLIAYYPLNSSGSQTDIVGGYNLTLLDGTAASVPGVVSNGITTSGGNYYLHSSSFPSRTVKTNSFTVSVWIKGIQSPWGDSSTLWGIADLALLLNGSLRFYIAGPGVNVNTGISIDPTVWTHVVVVQTASQLKLYKNGVLVYSYNGTNSSTGQDSAGLSLSAGPVGYPAPGSYDEFAIWSRALADGEVAQLYADQFPPILRITQDLTNQSVLLHSNTSFTISATNASPISYQWYFVPTNGGGQAGAYAQTISGFVYGVVVTNGGFGYGNVPGVSFIGGGGSGAAGYATVSNGVVSGVTVTNAGTGYTSVPNVVFGSPNGFLYGETNNTLNIFNASTNNVGTYYVVLSSDGLSITSSVVSLTLLYLPSIASEPSDQYVNAHSNAVFSVTAAGTPPLVYQWMFNGTNLPNAKSSILSITNVTPDNLGSYAVRVANNYGSITSSIANLYMYPFIANPFTGLVTYWGQTNTLSVGAWGSGVLSYQWYQDGIAVPDATNQTLTLSGIQFTNAGLYYVVVSSSLGSVTNSPYQVVVNPASVALGLFPGVIITGTVGYNYIIQSTSDLGNPNSWTTLTNITLSQPIQIWNDNGTDTTKPGNPHKFYKVLPGQ
jgi:hypothetical protein